MILRDLSALPRLLPPATRLMGLDLGTRTIGVALSDLGLMIATADQTVKRRKFNDDFAQLDKIIDRNNVGAIVIGYPREMDGSEGKACHRVQAFADEVLKRRDIPILYWDERLSTAAVERVLIEEADMTRKRRAEVVDKTAAAYILQGALDALDRLQDTEA